MQSKLVILLTVLIWAHLNSLAQDKWNANSQHKQLYESAFLEITQMLQGAKPVSFKRAVFLTENAFLNGNWTYERFNGQITAISIKLKQLIGENALIDHSVALQIDHPELVFFFGQRKELFG